MDHLLIAITCPTYSFIVADTGRDGAPSPRVQRSERPGNTNVELHGTRF